MKDRPLKLTLKTLLIKLVVSFHMAALLFLVFGWLSPKALLPFHIVAIPVVVLHWWFNQNQCILTQIQHKLEGRPKSTNSEGAFIRQLFLKIGWRCSDRWLLFTTYGVLLLSGSISGLRLALF